MKKNNMRVPFGTVSITDRSKNIIREILDSNRVSCGKYVREFEMGFAKLVGSKESVALSSGADADALAMAVLYDYGARRGDEIIVPALSFVATGNAVLQAGFKPVFVDIELDTLNIDPSKIEAAITKNTRAILAVHLVGKPADMKSINRIARKHKLFVIEDAAEAHGAVYEGKNVGTLGDMAAFSLYVAHIITTVEGGIVTTDNKKYAEILRSLRSHGRACKCHKCVLNVNSGYCGKRFQHGKKNDIRFIFERIGYSAKMNELEAAIGIGNLEEYRTILAKRRHNLRYLSKRFKKFSPYMLTIESGANEKIGPHAFPVIIQKKAPFTREDIIGYMERRGVETRTLFSSMPTQCPGFKFLGHKLGEFPGAEYVGDKGFHIGVHQGLGEEQLDYFLDCTEAFLDKVIG